MDCHELVEWQIKFKLDNEDQQEIITRNELDQTARQNAATLKGG